MAIRVLIALLVACGSGILTRAAPQGQITTMTSDNPSTCITSIPGCTQYITIQGTPCAQCDVVPVTVVVNSTVLNTLSGPSTSSLPITSSALVPSEPSNSGPMASAISTASSSASMETSAPELTATASSSGSTKTSVPGLSSSGTAPLWPSVSSPSLSPSAFPPFTNSSTSAVLVSTPSFPSLSIPLTTGVSTLSAGLATDSSILPTLEPSTPGTESTTFTESTSGIASLPTSGSSSSKPHSAYTPSLSTSHSASTISTSGVTDQGESSGSVVVMTLTDTETSTFLTTTTDTVYPPRTSTIEATVTAVVTKATTTTTTDSSNTATASSTSSCDGAMHLSDGQQQFCSFTIWTPTPSAMINPANNSTSYSGNLHSDNAPFTQPGPSASQAQENPCDNKIYQHCCEAGELIPGCLTEHPPISFSTSAPKTTPAAGPAPSSPIIPVPEETTYDRQTRLPFGLSPKPSSGSFSTSYTNAGTSMV